MSTFKYYNVQILPLKKKDGMIGLKGYKKVFDSLEALVDKSIKEQSLSGISFSLLNDFFIAPISVNTRDDIAFGEFLKYDNVTTIVGTLSDEEKYVSKGGDSSKKYKYRYVFDFKRHILAIELKKGLPSNKVFIEYLDSILDFHITKNFPKHYLKIIEMTNAESLTNVITEAVSYKRVDVEITFSNSADWDNSLEELTLEAVEQELREKNIHSTRTIEKSEKETTMVEPTKNTMTKLALACKYGNASITYNDGEKRKIYKMVQHPIKLKVEDKVKNKQKSALDFALDVKNSIPTASELAISAKSLFKKLRKGILDESEEE